MPGCLERLLHRFVIPVSMIFSNLIAFGIQFGILLVLMTAHGCLEAPFT